MAANIDINNILGTVKGAVGVVSVILIAVACVRAFGVDIPYFKMSMVDIAALAASAAYVSRG